MTAHSTVTEQSVQNRITEAAREKGLSNADIARLSGRSPGTISQVMSGKYRGRPEIVDEILAAVEAHAPEENRSQWFTEGQKLILSILYLTWKTAGFSVVVGPSGIGKTYTAKVFVASNPHVRYLRCADGQSMGDVVNALLDLLGVPAYGSNSQRLRRAIGGLADQGVRMVIVDEADLLVTDGSKPKILKKISVFREVKEAGIGVALLGLESFDTALRMVGETYVTSRIDLFRRASLPTEAELQHYLAGLGLDPETEDCRRAIALAPRNGSLRFLEKAARIATQLGGNVLEALRVLFAASDHVKGV